MDILEHIGKLVYLCLPAIAGNMAPVLIGSRWPALARPLDFGKSVHEHRLFGDHKTWRGVIVAVLAAVIIALIQRYLDDWDFFYSWRLVEYRNFQAWGIGIAQGFGVMVGDAVKSFFKRQRGIPEGQSWFPWDQWDSAFGLFIVLPLFYQPSAGDLAIILLGALILHPLARMGGFRWHLTHDRW